MGFLAGPDEPTIARAGVRRADELFHLMDKKITNIEMGSMQNKKRRTAGAPVELIWNK
jgi:hypothetical protein